MMDRLMQPPEFPLAEAHATIITTLGMAMFYLPVLPISPMLATIGGCLGLGFTWEGCLGQAGGWPGVGWGVGCLGACLLACSPAPTAATTTHSCPLPTHPTNPAHPHPPPPRLRSPLHPLLRQQGLSLAPRGCSRLPQRPRGGARHRHAAPAAPGPAAAHQVPLLPGGWDGVGGCMLHRVLLIRVLFCCPGWWTGWWGSGCSPPPLLLLLLLEPPALHSPPCCPDRARHHPLHVFSFSFSFEH